VHPRAFVPAILLSVAVLACGCSSSSAAAPTTPFTVWIFDEQTTIADADAPLPNVMVALDSPAGGDRVVKTTEADGHVTFDADLSAGGVTISAFSSDHTLYTMLEATPDSARARGNTFGKPDGDLVIVLPRLDDTFRAQAIQLSGKITNKQDTKDVMYLAASGLTRLGDAETALSSYALRAPKNKPFFVIAHESGTIVGTNGQMTVGHIKAFRIEVPAHPADATLDIDVGAAAALPIKALRVHAQAPSNVFGTDTQSSAVVESADSRLLVGAFQGTTANSDGSFDIDIALADTSITPERVMTTATLVASDGSSSTRHELGVVADGTAWTDFLVPTTIPDGDRATTDPIPLDAFPPAADFRAEVFGASQLVWVVEGPTGGPRSKSLLLPAPLGIEFPVSIQLLSVSIIAEQDRVALAPHGQLYRHIATSRGIDLRRQ